MPLDALPPRFRHMVETYRLAPPFPAETAEVLAGCLAVQKAFALQLFRAGAPLCTGTDAGRRRVVVAPRGALETTDATVAEMNWLIPPPEAPLPCTVKLRAREVPRAASVVWDGAAGVARVRLDAPGIVAPGQACVMYDGDRVLGGGFLRAAPMVDRGRAAA